MKIRLAEVAERAGVSMSTVSRVLNDRPGVNDTTRRTVLTAIDVLGYERPARLRTRSDGLVGLIVPELANPFFPRLAQELEHQLSRYGYTPLLCSQSFGGIHEDEYVETLLATGVSGLVFVSGIHAMTEADTGRYTRLLELGLPFVLINGFQPGFTCLSTDDATAVRLAVSHLENMGHRKIGLAIGQDRYTPVQRRTAAFRGELRRLHPDLSATDLELFIERTAYTAEGGALAARHLLSQGVTGIVCGSDVMAMGAIHGVRQQGLSVPGDVSVIGCDDSSFNEFIDPPLSTVRQPAPALAEAACRHLIEQIGGSKAVHGDHLFQPELVARASTGRVVNR